MFPIAFSLGPVYISTFGLSLAVGFIVASFLLFLAVKNDLTFTPELLFDASAITMLGAILGGRVWYIFFHNAEFADSILLTILFRERPGLSFPGGFLGGTLALVLFSRFKQLDFFRLLDIATWAYVWGYFFGQIGSFFDGFSFGAGTNLPWGMRIFGSETRVHPLPLYEIIFVSLTILTLRFAHRATKHQGWKAGTTFLITVGCLSLFSATLDFRRSDMTMIRGVAVEQTFSFALTIFVLVLAYLRSRDLRQDIKMALAFMGEIRHNMGRKTTHHEISQKNS